MDTPPTPPEVAPPSLSEEVIHNPKALAKQRRKLSRRRFWRTVRKSRLGMLGLGILLFFSIMAIFGPLFVHSDGLDITKVNFADRLKPPSLQFPLGTDDQGRSVLTLIIYGSRVSLMIGLTAAIVSMVAGSIIGILAGYRGGGVDAILMRFTDWFLVLPFIPLAITATAILGPSTTVIVMVIGLTSWPWTARLVRSQTLSVRERPYIERARGLGASDIHLIRKHVLPNVAPVILAQTVLMISVMIGVESILSFLGIGDPHTISWGTMLEEAFSKGAITRGAWWWVTIPGLCITLVVLAFTLCGEALDEIFNPKLQKR